MLVRLPWLSSPSGPHSLVPYCPQRPPGPAAVLVQPVPQCDGSADPRQALAVRGAHQAVGAAVWPRGHAILGGPGR